MAQQFASDNNAGICPEALEALLRANAEGHVTGYGDDAWTEKACDRAARAVRDGLRGVLRLQRHGGQCAGAGADLPALSCRDRACAQPHRGGRGRRARAVLRRRQDRHGRHSARQADARRRSRRWRRRAAACTTSSRAPCRSRRPPSSAPSTRRTRSRALDRGGAPPWPEGAHGRRALRQCGGDSSAARRPTCPGGPASTCCASAGSRTGLAVGEAVLFFDRDAGAASSSGASSRPAISTPRCGW